MIQLDQDIVDAAKAAMWRWKIPASVSLAQYGLESGWGKHMPEGSLNPFGIKALPGQPSVIAATHEYVGGRYVTIKAAFRRFASLAEAFETHAELLATSPHYSIARQKLPDVEAFCAGLTGVYATDPHYGDELLAIIRGDQLERYDR